MTQREMAQRALALLTLLTGMAVVALAWPRFQASFHYLPVDTAIGNYHASRVIPTAQLDGLVARAEAAIARHDHYRYHEGLSFLHYLRALDEATPYWEKRPALKRSLRAMDVTLRRAPALPGVWLRMAQVQAALRAPRQHVLAPLRMSILTGRVEPPLLVPRLELGYRYLDALDAETSALLRDQTVLAWRVAPRAVTRAVREGRLRMERLRALLGGQREDVLGELEATLG